MSPLPDLNQFIATIARRLQVIYKDDFSEGHINRILGWISYYGTRAQPAKPWDEKDIVLITYTNTLVKPGEKPLRTLYRFLHGQLGESVSCVHLLPFFPFTSDDGFAVSDFMTVNPSLGDWTDVTQITKEFGLMADLVINHVSTSHAWFLNYLQDGAPGKGYFIEAESGTDYSRVVRPRNTPLFTRFKTSHGMRDVWTTFSDDQADLNFANPDVLIEMIRVLLFYISQGVRIVRLDAIAYLWKKAGTNCIHLPETHEIVKLLRDILSYINPGVLLLTETNVPNRENWSYFGENDEAHIVYQFGLPPLLLHALFTGNSEFLTRWAKEIPDTQPGQTFLNYTASHDGIGVRPLEGLLPSAEIKNLTEAMVAFGGRISEKTNPDGSSGPYEINITYLDAMKGDLNGIDSLQMARFICSQTIMMSFRGIPAFYIHSLIGTSNDYEGMRTTGRARSINRKTWPENELMDLLSKETMNRMIFNELRRLLKVRRISKAFHPDCPMKLLELGSELFAFVRGYAGTGEILCVSNLTQRSLVLPPSIVPGKQGYDLISPDNRFLLSESIPLSAYQTRWILID